MTTQLTPGMRIGNGVVIEAPVRVPYGTDKWRTGARLRCDCGNVYEARTAALTMKASGKINKTSCGCVVAERASALGFSNTRNRIQPGQRIGRGVVIDPDVRVTEGSASGHRGARLQCDCGNIYETRISNLIRRANGRISVMSCGCLKREKDRETENKKVRHGLHGHPLYNTWRTMVRRCRNPSDPGWHRYGGRGIDVCESWLDIAVFVADIECILGDRPPGCSLDRIDNDGGYEPGNVRWATAAEQTANREYQVALEFLAWARQHHPDVVAEFRTRVTISRRL